MKRFLFWFVAALAAIALLRSSHRSPDRPDLNRTFVIRNHTDRDRDVVSVSKGRGKGHRLVMIDSRGVTITDRDEDDDRDADGRDRDRDRDAEARDGRRQGLEYVDGLPVPIEPGSRVTEALPEPPQPPAAPRPPRAPKPPKHRFVTKAPAAPKPLAASQPKVEPVPVVGRLSATEDRARKETRYQLQQKVAEWVTPDVPSTWKVPDRLVDGLIREVRIAPHQKGDPLGTMYDATMLVDLSSDRRAEIVEAYNHEQTLKRLWVLGGGLAFVLACLATVSGYIRADEATKGYYTNRLRVASAAGLGAAGVLVYQWLT
jgi:hypothetical protein